MLLNNLKSGDATPDLDGIIRAHRAFIGRILRRASVAERDLPDVEQEVFLVVLRRLPDFEGRSSLRTWLCRIALNVASDYRRRACNRREALSLSDEGSVPLHGDPCPLERRDTLQSVATALERLSDEKREVFLLRELEELPMVDIARQQQVPLKTAFSRLYHARRELRALLLADGFSFGLFPIGWPRRWLSDLLASAPRSPVARPWQGSSLFKLGGMALACALVLPAAPTHRQPGAASARRAELARYVVNPQPSAANVTTSEARPSAAVSQPATAFARAVKRRPRRPAEGAPAPASRALVAEPAADFALYRTSAAEPSAPIQLPYGFELVPEPPAPTPLHVRGPRDTADAVEQALR